MEKFNEVKNIKRILVALDMSHMDDLLLQYVRFLSQSLKEVEEVVLYHNIRFDYPEEAEEILQSLDESLEDVLHQKIEEKAADYLQNVSCSVVIEENDDTAEAITHMQKRNLTDLILFGKKVSYDGSGYLIERVIYQKINAHVLVLPETGSHRIDKILVPIDFNKKSARAIYHALNLSETVGAKISCQYVYAVPNIYFPYIPVKNLQEEMKATYEKKWKSFTKKYLQNHRVPNITYSFHGERTISQIIYDHSLQQQIDLMVLPLEVGFTHNTVIQLLKIDLHTPILMIN